MSGTPWYELEIERLKVLEIKPLKTEVDRLRAELAVSRKLSSMYYRRAVEAADRSGDAAWVEEHERYNGAVDALGAELQRAEKAEAAIARVRELCAPDVAMPSKTAIYKAEVLRALGNA